MITMITCPKCRGDKLSANFLPAFPSKKMLEKTIEELREIFHCTQCGGKGKVPKEMLQWIKDGEILKDKRIKASYTLRNAARMFKIKPSTLSEMERGIIKPNMSLDYSIMKVIRR